MSNAPAPSTNGTIRLPRGGLYVPTPAGPIQFGVPPETIKDSMSLGLPIPQTFVVHDRLFDKRRGLNLAEVEFPAYYNYFVLKRRIRLVVDGIDTERRIRAVFQESLFGPSHTEEEEYDSEYPAARRPDFRKETDHFRREGGRRRSLEDLLDFLTWDGDRIELEDGVCLDREESGEIIVSNLDGEIARAPAELEVPERHATPSRALKPFDPPAFGVTVLGASHGFDPNGKTTGFVLWINGRGILIDPPEDTTEHLKAQGVAPQILDGVILTHCHADHDSGVFQKLLEERQIALYTTPTVLGSFLRKYSALSGIGVDLLRRTFKFRPVKIGAPVSIRGADFLFFYTLHSIPALGFQVFFGGKSLSFSGDTLYDPAYTQRLCDDGVITPERRDALLGFPWHSTVVLHEAGVPPLHTPTSCLAALPEDVKQRLYLVHIARKDVPEGQGLRAAPVGLDGTIRIEVEPPDHAAAVEILDHFCAIDFIRELPLARARELLLLARKLTFGPGAKIITQGAPGHEFYVMVSGSVEVVRDGVSVRVYAPGEYFGETALVLDQARTADVIARSNVTVLKLDRHGFLYLMRGTDIPRRLVRLARAREEHAWQLLDDNHALRLLSGSQRTQFQSCLEMQVVADGDVLWRKGEPADRGYLVEDAAVVLEGAGELQPFVRGALLAEVDALGRGLPFTTTARVVKGGRVFRVDGEYFGKFLQKNPGLLLSFLGARFIE